VLKPAFAPILLVVFVTAVGFLVLAIKKPFNFQFFTKPTRQLTVNSLKPQNVQSQSLVETEKTIYEDQKKEESNPNQNYLGTVSGPNYKASVFALASTTVVTDSANDDNCTNNCPTKSLAQYVKENGGRGGMNGTYFCPPDYSWCAGKVGSYDFPVWNNRRKKWMEADKLFWNGRGMMVFRSGSAQFFSCAACTGAPGDITGGIVNYPSLVSGGKLILDEGSLTSNFKTKGTRSGIGFGNGKLFLVVARSANIKDLAGIFISLGATDALNLDGGGSAALYESGRYKAGPGRSLPNAIIVK